MMPTGPGWWWLKDGGDLEAVGVFDLGINGTLALRYWVAGVEGHRRVTDDGHWIAPVLTPDEADALTERAERAERERDEARRWAEAAAADENANAADLRAARATLDAIAALVGPGDVVERVRALVAANAALRAAGVMS